MANYNESTVNGVKWTRSNSVRIFNDYAQPGKVCFDEEEIVSLGGADFMRKQLGSIEQTLTPENILTEFNLLNPETGDTIGTATYQQVYVLLHSLYLHLAAERDAAAVVVPTPEPAPE